MAGVGMPAADADLTPLFEAIVDTIPAPVGDPDGTAAGASSPTSTRPTTSAAWPSAGSWRARCAAARTWRCATRRRPRAQPPLVRKLTQLLGFDGISRVEVDERGAGDLFVIAGFPEVEIGDTLADPVRPEAAAAPRASTSRCCA